MSTPTDDGYKKGIERALKIISLHIADARDDTHRLARLVRDHAAETRGVVSSRSDRPLPGSGSQAVADQIANSQVEALRKAEVDMLRVLRDRGEL